MFEAEERQWWYVGMRRITDGLLRPYLRTGTTRQPLLLDAGCGTGANLLHFGDVARVVGVDLSREAVAFCAARGTEVVRGSVLELPFASGVFDCVTSFDVLYHSWVKDDAAAVAELVRVLAPGGVLFVRLPALRILYGAHDVEVQTRHRYTSGELRALPRRSRPRSSSRLTLLQQPPLPGPAAAANARPVDRTRGLGRGLSTGSGRGPLPGRTRR